MNVLILGGTGIISTACVELAVARGMDVSVLNRARRERPPKAVTVLTADIAQTDTVAAALGNRSWDVVVDFLAYQPADIEQRLRLLRGRASQYFFISSASAYQKPLRGHALITESTPLANPFWEYSRNKIACEERLMRAWREDGFPVTIVRPSLTYGDMVVPLAVNVWAKSYTAVDRLRRGKQLIIPGDGLTLWTITHNSDFAKGLVGLFGNLGALGNAFHITSDEALSWNEIYALTAQAAGVGQPSTVHIASDFLVECLPESRGSLLGDKAHTALFDNTKIKRFVPDFAATTPFREGIARTLAWFDAEPGRQEVDWRMDAVWDNLISDYERGLKTAMDTLRR